MMNSTWYERLSVLDYSFLAFEGANSYMHIAAAAVFDATPVATKDGGIDIARIRRYVDSRLPSIPRYRQRLAYIPVENHPVWIDDDHFDLVYHVRHTSLPRPGSDPQLRELCARILERPLNRAKPLWEIWVIEGLAGRRFGLVMKVHHCMVDGLGGVELLAALLQPTADTPSVAATAWQPRPAPSSAELLRDEVARRAKMSIELARRLRSNSAAGEPGEGGWGGSLKAVWELVREGIRRPVPSPLNQPIGPHRRFHWATCDLAALKEVKNELGGTLNDVVLATVSGAVRAFFERRGFAADGMDFKVAVPVNVRAEEERHTTGNRVSAWLVSLPIHEHRPTRRLLAVQELSRHLKESNQALGGRMLTQAAEWTSTNVLTLGALLSSRVQPFNLIVTNVPGPQFPLYLLGARMEAIYPQVPLFESQGLGIALFSYDGKLFWGFNGDWDVLPDLEEFVRDIEASFRGLSRAARRRHTAAGTATPAPRPVSALASPPPLRRAANARW
jgi:diacylglycerol O-acyltransferase / wax synthase